jgi:hypothetical protein
MTELTAWLRDHKLTNDFSEAHLGTTYGIRSPCDFLELDAAEVDAMLVEMKVPLVPKKRFLQAYRELQQTDQKQPVRLPPPPRLQPVPFYLMQSRCVLPLSRTVIL